MRKARLLVALPLAAAVLSACGSDPGAERRQAVAALTEAANAGDADAVREQADALVETVAAQVERQELAADEAQRLTALAEAVRRGADLIDEDLIERRKAEQAAEQARRELEEAQNKLEEERRKTEEERRKGEDGKGEDGKGEDGKGEDGKGEDGKGEGKDD